MILVQSDSERKLPHHFDAACALYGAMENAVDYRLTSFEEIQSGRLNNLLRNNLAVGSTEFMREVFKQLGKEEVRLPSNSDRDCEIITLGEAHKRVAAGKKLFVKPVEIKLFTGLVLDGFKYSSLKGLPDDTKVMAYEPFKSKILSEWRVYIHNHKIVDSRFYSGDFKHSPDYMHVECVAHINQKEKFPSAYTIDIAVLDELQDYDVDYGDFIDNINEVVEFNDMWAIGNYGMPNDLYYTMLKDRYFEIIKS